ncbi:MAG: TonB family protein [Nitrospira sp.]|nr:MAG: TonB family protein [Nitrospira sp.]
MRCCLDKVLGRSIAGLGLALGLVVFSAPAQAGPPPAAPPSAPKRWAQFELMNAETDGTVQAGKDVVLSITLGGVSAGTESVIAIIESPGFQSQTVSLSEDSTPVVYQGTAILEPNSTLKSPTTVHPKAVRLRVTFARAKITGLDEFFKRDVYVTLGDKPAEESETELTPAPPADSGDIDPEAVQKATEQVMAVNATIAEEDILPLPPPGESKAYWKQVSDLISRNWGRQVRSIRRAPSSETVRVQFKMYASGVAQLIQLEKGSGARDLNDAGLQTIIHAHPFPPLPPEVGGEVVDVHVRMRTGAKVANRDVEMTVEKKPSKSAARQPSTPKDGPAVGGSAKE